MKSKSSHHQSENTFRFQSFNERITTVNIDVIRRVEKRSATPEDDDTFFGEALQKWTELNCTEHFVSFRKEIQGHVQSLAQLIYHEETIVKALIKHLQVENSMAFQPLLDLVVQLARDLQLDFYKHFKEFFEVIISLLNNYTQDVAVLEQAFVCLAYIFKFLWRHLVRDIQDVYSLFSPLLGQQYKEYIQNFAAESFAYLMRKVKDPSLLFDFMFTSLKESPDQANGLGRLLFEMLRGVKSKFHSCTEKVLPIILSKLGTSSSDEDADNLPYELVYTTLEKMMVSMTTFTAKENTQVVWTVLSKQTSDLQTLVMAAKKQKRQPLEEHLCRLLGLMKIWVTHGNGALVINPSDLSTTLNSLLRTKNLAESCIVATFDMVAAMFTSSFYHLSSNQISTFIGATFKVNVSCSSILSFIKKLFDVNCFDKSVLPALLQYCHDCSLKNKAETYEEILYFVTDLVLFNTPIQTDASDINHWKNYALDFKLAFKGRTYKNSFPSYLMTKLKFSPDVPKDDREVSLIWGALISLPCIQPIDNERAIVDLSTLLSSLIDYCEHNETACESTLMLIGQLVSSVCSMVSVQEFFDVVSLDVIQKLIRCYAKNADVLRCADIYFTYATLHEKTELLTANVLETIFPALQSNLSSPSGLVRRLTLRVLNQFVLQLPEVEGEDELRSSVFQVCLDAELVPVTVHESRNKLMYLRKLEHDLIQSHLPVGSFSEVPLRYLIGMLHVNFTMYWKPVMELIQSHAYGMDKTAFWDVFWSFLDTATADTEKISTVNLTKTRQTAILATQRETMEVMSLVELMHHNSLTSLHQQSPSDCRNFRTLLWQTMLLFPDKCEARSRTLSPLVFRFLKNEYYTADLNMAPNQDISVNNTGTNSTEEAVSQATDVDEPTDLESMQEIEEVDEDDDLSGKRYRKAATKTLVQMLSLFAKFKSPKSLFMEPKLHELYYELLHHQEPNIQKGALECLMTYNYKYLMPYKENFDRLLDDKNFKNEIVLFSIDTEHGVVLADHREGLLPILMRILYGKMLYKTGRDTTGKGRSEVRRGIVFRFLAGSQGHELKLFLDLIFQPFMNSLSDNVATRVQEIVDRDTISRIIPLRKQHGILNTIDVIFKKLGNLIEVYLPTIIQVVVCQAAEFAHLLKLREQVNSKAVNSLKMLRQLAVSRIVQFFASFNSYPFSKNEIDAIFHAVVWPQVEKLPFEGLYHPTPLLKLFFEWSKDNRYFPLLSMYQETTGVSALQPVFSLLLAKNVNSSVVACIMEMVENLLTSPDFDANEDKRPELAVSTTSLDRDPTAMELTEDSSLGTRLLLPHVPAILQHIRGVVKSLSGQAVKRHNFPTRELNILSKISIFVCEPEKSSELIQLLLPFLAKNVARSPDVEIGILQGICNLMTLADNPAQFLGALSQLFASIQDRNSRSLLCDILKAVATRESRYEFLSQVIVKLNAWDKRRVDEPDYMTRLDAFHEIKQAVKEATGGQDQVMLQMVIHNCCFFICNVDDMSLRDSSSFCIQEIVKEVAKTMEDLNLYKHIVTDTILPEIRGGLRHKLDSPRQEFLSILALMARQFPARPIFCDMACLLDDDPESDFFENLKHIQTHRRARALRRLNKYLSLHLMKTEILVCYLLPIATSFLADETFSKVQNLVDASIETIAAICGRLPWDKYAAVLRRYLFQLTKTLENQKVIVRIVVGILDAFHFDLSATETLPVVPDTKAIEEPKENDEEMMEEDEDTVVAMETEPSTNVEDAPEQSATEKHKCSPALAARINRVILKHIIPRLHRCLVQKAKSDGEHKLVKSNFAEDSEILRVPIALAMVKLIQNFPAGTLNYTLPGILLKVCQFLKSRAKDIRDVARDTLLKILDSLGPGYFSFVLKELRSALTRGYQLHVLCFTVHQLLKNIAPILKPGDLDSSLKSLVQIFNEDLFGHVADEKEVVGITSKLFEAKSSKSYDAYHIISRFISKSSLSTLIVPLKQALDSTHSHKVAKKVQEVLKRVSFGLLENEGLTVETLMVFVHGLTNESLPCLSADVSKSETKVSTRPGERPPSTYLLKANEPRGKSKPKTNVKTNMHMMVEFGLHILNGLLKQSKVSMNDSTHLGMLDPFVEILNTCLSSKYVRIASTALRCLCWVLRTSLPSLKEAITRVTNNLFVMLKNYAVAGVTKGDNFELVVLCFKAMTVLVRDVKFHTIDTNQLQVLLTYVEEDILDTNRQATAFGLLKAILSRKLMVSEIHVLMKKVANLSVTAESAHVRLQCRQVMLQFMLDYPLGKKLQQHLEFYITQLPYEHESGRESVLEMMATIFATFPQNLLLQYSGIFFVPLSVQLINDESVRCKKLTALAIKSLLEKLDNEHRDQLFSIVLVWFQNAKVSHRRLAAHVCGLFVEVESAKFDRHLVDILPVIEQEIEPGRYEQSGDDSSVTRDSDHMIYQVLNTLLKITRECTMARNSKHAEIMCAIWGHVYSHLLHPHTWVRLVSSQLFGLLFASWPVEDVVTPLTAITDGEKSIDYMQVDTRQKIHDLSASFCRQLQSAALDQELADQVVKNLVYTAKVIFTGTKNNFFSETDAETPLTLRWLIKRMGREATFEAAQNQKTSIKRSSVFKWMAAVAMEIGADSLPEYLQLFLPPLFRESTSIAVTADPALKTLSQEVMDIMKNLVGVEAFTKAYSSVHKNIFDKRETRKHEKAVEAVANPEVAARKKIKKNLAKKEAKKRKITEFKPSKKLKKQKLQDFAIVD